jgi:hypothetical protein
MGGRFTRGMHGRRARDVMPVRGMCRPWRGLLFVSWKISHHCRGGLRCVVPPGLCATESSRHSGASESLGDKGMFFETVFQRSGEHL